MSFQFEEFITVVNMSHKTLQKLKSYKFEKYGKGIKGYHLFCMHYLENNGGLTCTELAYVCKEDKAAVSRYLKKLYDLGYVKIEDEDGKKYKLKNVLTEKGKEVYAEYRVQLDKFIKAVDKGLTPSKADSFGKSLNIIAKNLERITDELIKW